MGPFIGEQVIQRIVELHLAQFPRQPVDDVAAADYLKKVLFPKTLHLNPFYGWDTLTRIFFSSSALGYQSRLVFCTIDNEAYPDYMCRDKPKPANNQTCGLQTCPQTKRWALLSPSLWILQPFCEVSWDPGKRMLIAFSFPSCHPDLELLKEMYISHVSGIRDFQSTQG